MKKIIRFTNSVEVEKVAKDEIIGVVTHKGTFHADEVTAIALLKMFYPKAKVILCKRVGHQEELESHRKALKKAGAAEVFTLDIGRELKADELKFDHHQLNPKIEEGQISSAGLIFNWLKEKEYINELIISKLEKLVRIIDLNDTGVRPAKIYEIPEAISYMNSDDVYNDGVQNDAFSIAVYYMIDFLSGIKAEGEKLWNAVDKLKECINNRPLEGVLEMSEYIPFWDVGIFDIPELDDVDIVIWEEKRTGEWKTQVVPDLPGSFGRRGRKLVCVEPYPKGIKFIHKGEFFAVAEDKEDLLDYIRDYAK